MKSLRKGSSSENLFNQVAMTLSRRSRRGSNSRDRAPKDLQTHDIDLGAKKTATKESLTNVLVENRARITTFVRSLQPYYAAEIEQGRRSSQLASESKNLQSLSHIKTNQISGWLDDQLTHYRDNQDYPLATRHNRKSSVSSVNSISSSKSDSCSSGSMRLTEPPIFEQNGLRHSLLKIPSDVSQYRLSSTSHDSGFTSHAHDTETPGQSEEFSKNRTNSWKDWPKPGPYDNNNRNHSTIPTTNNENNFDLPPPPPECMYLYTGVPFLHPFYTKFCLHLFFTPNFVYTYFFTPILHQILFTPIFYTNCFPKNVF